MNELRKLILFCQKPILRCTLIVLMWLMALIILNMDDIINAHPAIKKCIEFICLVIFIMPLIILILEAIC